MNYFPEKVYHFQNYCIATYVQHVTFIKKNFDATFQKIKDRYFDTQNRVHG